jgi:hypothetical protein
MLISSTMVAGCVGRDLGAREGCAAVVGRALLDRRHALRGVRVIQELPAQGRIRHRQTTPIHRFRNMAQVGIRAEQAERTR